MISNNKINRTNTQIKNNKLNKTKRNNNTKKQNTHLERLKVSYPDTLLQAIKNTQDISQFPNIYKNAPQITILNAKPKLYLITMTDPDAPYGMSHNNTSNTKNHTYTHWIYLQDMRKKQKNNTNTTTNTPKPSTILLPYAPPSPPYGMHRYQIKLYDMSNVLSTTLDTLKKNINKSLDRNVDYISTINNINNKNNINLMPIVQFQYRVNSGK